MIEIDINEQIKKHLPAQVGEVLKSRLELADRAEALHEELEQERERRKEVQVQGERHAELMCEKLNQIAALTKELEEFKAREEKLKIDEAILATKLELTDKHRIENLDVVKAVFQNNRIKYRESGNMPLAVPGADGGQYQSPIPGRVEYSPFDKSIEQES